MREEYINIFVLNKEKVKEKSYNCKLYSIVIEV